MQTHQSQRAQETRAAAAMDDEDGEVDITRFTMKDGDT
jgi:hypothetical protein